MAHSLSAACCGRVETFYRAAAQVGLQDFACDWQVDMSPLSVLSHGTLQVWNVSRAVLAQVPGSVALTQPCSIVTNVSRQVDLQVYAVS